MKKLVIMRGIPGSGKSTLATKRYPTAVVCSADHYHMRNDPAGGAPIYDWKAENQGAAHRFCQSRCELAMQRDEPLVLIDNTNIKRRDFAPYVAMAGVYGYEVVVHEVLVKTAQQLATCVQRNVHRVPADVVCKMLLAFNQEGFQPGQTLQVVSEEMEGV